MKVDEYVADELAGDSDKKQLFKDEARAGRKLEAPKAKGNRFPYQDKGSNRPSAQVGIALVNEQSGIAGNLLI